MTWWTWWLTSQMDRSFQWMNTEYYMETEIKESTDLWVQTYRQQWVLSSKELLSAEECPWTGSSWVVCYVSNAVERFPGRCLATAWNCSFYSTTQMSHFQQEKMTHKWPFKLLLYPIWLSHVASAFLCTATDLHTANPCLMSAGLSACCEDARWLSQKCIEMQKCWRVC